MNATVEAIERFRQLCLDLPETHETGSWGHPNFRAGKRTFAAFEWVRKRPALAFRVGAEDVDALLLRGEPFFAPPYGRGQWIGIWADGAVDWALAAELVERSFRRVALKRMLAALDGAAHGGNACA